METVVGEQVVMALRPVNDEVVLKALDARMAGRGNGERTARELGVESSQLRGMKSGYRPITQHIASKLGFELRWVRRGKGGGDDITG